MILIRANLSLPNGSTWHWMNQKPSHKNAIIDIPNDNMPFNNVKAGSDHLLGIDWDKTHV